MTILSKIKTLIDYAKFGKFQCQMFNKKQDELFFPRSIETYERSYNSGWNMYATKLTGYLKSFGGINFLGADKPIIEIDLPECTSVLANPNTGLVDGTANTVLKVIKLPKLRNIPSKAFQKLEGLEYLELGVVTSFHTYALYGSVNVKEIYVKEGTTSSLYLYHCPNLTQECLHKIIENYADMNGATAPTFHIGGANLLKVDTEHIIMLEEKNIFYQ
jgi:hypothetical protein